MLYVNKSKSIFAEKSAGCDRAILNYIQINIFTNHLILNSMKKLKLFFACLLMSILSIGQVWATDYYVKVTSAPTDWSGDYLIVYETGNVAFNGGLTTLDATSNTISVTITDSKIEANATTNAAKFTIASVTGGYSIQSASGKYIGVSANSNGLKQADEVGSYTHDLSIENGAAVIKANFSGSTMTMRYNNASNQLRFRYFKSSQQAIQLYKFEGGSPQTDVCAAPTFTPTSGDFAGSINVTLACTTEGAAIHYTTDGTDPTASSATYTAAISVSETTTIKAIAVADGYDNSSVASKTYTKHEAYTTIQALFEDKTGTSTPVYVTFDGWKISGVKGSQAFLTDGTKGLIIYQNSHGFNVGDALSGTAACNLVAYKGAAELTGLTNTSDGLTVTAGSMGDAVAKTIDELGAVNTSALVTISNVTYDGTNLSDGTNSIKPYNGLFSYTMENGKKYNVTGVLNYYDALQIMPRSAADVVEVVEEGAPEAPTFSPAAGTYTSVQSVEISCETEGATIYYTTDGSTPDNTSTEYTAAITVDANMTIKAIAIKDAVSSSIVSAAYVINLPADPEVTCTWDLSTTSYVNDPEPTADLIQWTSTYVSMKAEKNTGSIGVNNYIPSTRTSTRFYTGNKITFTPQGGKQITTIVITAATSGYATALKNATWTNGSAAAGSSDSEVVITAAGADNVVCVLGSNTGITAVTVNYEPYVAPATYAVSFAAHEHGSLAIANGEDPISSGDEFVAGTELTVSAEPASGYVLNAIKVIETGSDPENDVTSTVLAGATLTVPAYAITVSATFVENVAPVATLTLSENGVEAPFAGEHHQGDVVNLPLTSSADCVKDFVGWSANASCSVAPEYAPGAEYTLASTEQTLYAVYATASGSSYVKTALASIASGSEVVVTEAKTVEEVTTIWALTYNTTSKKTIASVVTDAENVLDVAGLTNGFWILTKDGDNFSLTAKGTTDKLYCTNSNDGVRVGSGDANTFSIKDSYIYTSATDEARYLGVYNATEFRCYTSINSNIKDQTLAFYKKTASYSDYATTCVAALADPEFTPAAGVYAEAKNIVITAEEGTIYYTLDGTDPTSSSTEYTAPIVLDENGTTTIKAIAISATSQSAIVSATYTINLPLSTIQAVYDKAVEVGGTETAVNIQFNNWVVSGISTDNKNVYVTDGEKGFVIYNSDAEHGFAVNDKLNGTVATSLKLYNKFADVVGLKADAEGLIVTHDGVITPVAATIADLGAVNTGAPIILNGVLFDGSVLSDGVNSITPYTTFYADAVTSLESDKYYNITGIYVQFNNTKKIAPRSAADIVVSVLVDPEISYDPASDEITKGEEGSWSAPTLVNENGVTIASYASDNEEVATVTDGGVISLAGGTGTAHITAHSNATSTYAAGNAIYTITVNAPAPTPSGTTYRKVTATADITDGEYLIVYETTSVAFDGSLETLDAVDNTVDVTINEGEIAGTAAIDAAVFTIDVTAGSIKSASNKYIGVSSYSNGLSVSDDADAFENALSIDADGNAVIVITTTSGDMTLRYNSASNQLRFRYYKSGQQAIQLYKKVVEEPEYETVRSGLTAGNYYTVCYNKTMTKISGASLWSFAGKDASMAYLVEAEKPYAAGTPYFIYAESDKLEAVVEEVPNPEAGSNNGLYGTFVNLSNADLQAKGATYMLYQNALHPIGAGHLDAFRAYVILEAILGGAPSAAQVQGRRVRQMPLQGQTATGLDELNASETPVKMVINGQLYIMYNGTMYNVQGQLVR